MLFNSKIFILLFLPVTLIGYFMLNRVKKERAGMVWLIVASLVFYGYFKPVYLVIIISSILVNYVVSIGLDKIRISRRRTLIFILGLIFDLGLLFVFKYYDFFIENINSLFHSKMDSLKLIMPLGISFFTFQQISFVIDSYKREMKPYLFIDYAAYVLFFPQLIAGPIVLHTELIPQFTDQEQKKFSQEWFAKGLYAFSLGLAKKVLLADTLGLIVNTGFAEVGSLDTTNAVIVMLSYTLQIYFDFSGYCDMARGIGYMFHIELPINFNSPYKAASVQEFWKRWHITLTRFLTRYCYIPLGGNRRGKLREYRNVLIVFAISGFWHGANWTFIVWGLMHGCVIVFERIFKKYLCRIPHIIRHILTFCFVSVSWLYFRADNLHQANLIVRKIFSFKLGPVQEEIRGIILNLEEVIPLQFLASMDLNKVSVFILVFLLIASLASCLFMKNTQEKMLQFKPTVSKSLITIFLLCYGIISMTGASIFLYFNF